MRSVRRAAKFVLVIVVLAACGGGAYVWDAVYRQGVPDSFWDDFKTASVRMDEHGIPTVAAKDWGAVVEAQGYVVAASRLWQMDLMRRKAGGRLAELFGEKAFEHDARMAREGRLAAARRGVELLPSSERTSCDLYAQGVNAFIADHPGKWGAEYRVLGAKPERWTCADSLLVLLEMAETLSGQADSEARDELWRRHLSPAWQAFLYPVDHPWNRPMFPGPTLAGPPLPPASEALRRRPLAGDELGAGVDVVEPALAGSNNWAWRGRTGVFLANDPHLGVIVPNLWYAMRLRRAADDWVVGAALPGLPGIVLGMNPRLAWAFTNTGEDVDDYLLETLNDDGTAYHLGVGPDGADVWRPLTKSVVEVKVRGESEPRRVEAVSTERGPLVDVPTLGAGKYSRQWLPLKEGMLRLPTVGVMRARSMDEMDRALDDMTVPSQNVLVADADGVIGYRMSGRGVTRKVSGRRPLTASEGQWVAIEGADQRPRKFLRADAGVTAHLATANERIVPSPWGGSWASDDRKDRIERVLSSRDNLVREDMERLQLDTVGRFRVELLRWVADRAGAVEGPAAAIVAKWRAWDGDSRSDPRIFAQSTVVERRFFDVLLRRVASDLLGPDGSVEYGWYMKRAWLLSVIGAPGDEGLAPFGLTAGEMAAHLLDVVVQRDPQLKPHPETNRFGGRHVFVGRIPIVSKLFEVDTPPQWGAPDLVLAERIDFGPSMRLVWDLEQPTASTWIFPVGQSGHAGSPHYADMQRLWARGSVLPVFGGDGVRWARP